MKRIAVISSKDSDITTILEKNARTKAEPEISLTRIAPCDVRNYDLDIFDAFHKKELVNLKRNWKKLKEEN